MNEYSYVSLRQRPELKEQASLWFHEKWDVSVKAYARCIETYINEETDLGWYVCLDKDRIIGGLGVIENDFHDRKDLKPNICAVYTEKTYRNEGIAGHLLDRALNDLHSFDISPVYLVTDHTNFL